MFLKGLYWSSPRICGLWAAFSAYGEPSTRQAPNAGTPAPNLTAPRSSTEFAAGLPDVPTLILHGDDDQIVPIGSAALLSSKLVKNATPRVYAGASHGLAYTHKDRLNADLLEFLKT
jgi:pimeloyl-ACP methyl ester carboxylesterase